jgi:hypothetical protein
MTQSDPAIPRNTDDKRWSTEGTIVRFNALRLLLIQDRADYPDFKIKWLIQVRTEMGGNLDPDANDVEDLTQVEADDDLFPEMADAQPVLNSAKQTLGVSNEPQHSDDDDSSQGG